MSRRVRGRGGRRGGGFSPGHGHGGRWYHLDIQRRVEWQLIDGIQQNVVEVCDVVSKQKRIHVLP